MKVIVIQELKPYSFEQIINWLDIEEKEAKIAMDSLIVLNILKKLSSSEQKMELEDLLDVEALEDIVLSIDKIMYVFKYVFMVIFLCILSIL